MDLSTSFFNKKYMLKNYLKLHFIILILGFTAILGKLISAPALIVVFYRTLIASIGILVILILRKREIVLSKANTLKLLGVGAVLGIHWLCFFGSARLANVSLSLVTFSTTSFFTSLVEPYINKTKLNYKELLLGFLAMLGMAIVFSFEYQYYMGIFVGLFGAFLAAVFSAFNGKLIHKFPANIISFYELSGAFITILILCIGLSVFTENLPLNEFNLNSTDWLWISVLAVVCTVYPYVEMINLYKSISVFTANLSLNMEPIYGVVLAYFIFGESEKMSSGFYIGGFLVFVSVGLQAYLQRIRK